MTWLIEDRHGEIHEILEDERVLVLARNQWCARNWLQDNHLPAYGRQFTVAPSARALEGGRWPVILLLDCFHDRPDAAQIKSMLDRNSAKLRQPPRGIEAVCR